MIRRPYQPSSSRQTIRRSGDGMDGGAREAGRPAGARGQKLGAAVATLNLCGDIASQGCIA